MGKMLKRLISYNKARDIVFNEWDKFLMDKIKIVPLLDALDKVSHEDIESPVDLPMFDRAAMDGYAVRAEDTFGASTTNPLILNLVDSEDIDEGECVKVFTGSKMPKNANAVVMKEYCNEEDDFVEIYKGVHPYENVSRTGEDVKRGDILLKKGEIISPYHIAILSSVGIKEIKVYDVNVGIIATGDELVDLEEVNNMEELKNKSKIINSNSLMLYALVKEAGLNPKIYGKIDDDKEKIKSAVKKAITENDIVITTGGTSVGDRDYIVEVINELGNIIIHGVQIRPGKPFGFGKINNKLIFMLSGYPVASAVQFELFIRSYFKKRKKIKLPLKRNIASELGRTDIVRVKIEDSEVEPLRITGSGVISSLTKADGYIIIPENVEGYEKGEYVEVYLF
ncbi:molybdopterin molybdotransferase MoeA [Methanotorris igneus]|uniref:molybdopterin molybdotransferase n=1 Tax=Methanotorris igneus (strain DSM 5666 / JCM 11834 / Kol 5) TaxID=880724 RepID=F6BD17_METIK|nr:gephyrin-like molybdotransferase Glp [Methanotorris igneus]AEF96378.1 molybdenum cofactor synthesis domain protein [Methanotorris igneus Kol 5]